MTTAIVLPPTSRLPPIKALGMTPIGQLYEATQYLQTIYNPEIRSSRRVTHGEFRKSGPSHNSDTTSWEAISSDTFEYAYAIRWLTALIAQSALRSDVDGVETLIQSAAALLACCAGAASAGTRTRTYALGGVRVQLTDVALRNDDYGSVGAQTWGGACVLAEMIAEAPARFGLGSSGDDGGVSGTAATVRVLELGAGTGLVSLTIGKIIESHHGCSAEVVASDFHPLALENLKLNIKNNFSPSSSRLLVSAHFLDWEEAADPANALEAPFNVPFDEVFGADVVYEVEHAAWINACLRRLVRLTGNFHLVMPIREGFARESEAIEHLFPHVEDMHRTSVVEPTLCITRKETIICEGGLDSAAGRRGDVEYVHYTIQWANGGDGQEVGLHEE